MKIDMEFKGLEELVKAFESAASDEDIAQVNKTIAEKGEPVVQRIMSGKIPKSKDIKKSGRGFGSKSSVSAHAADEIPIGKVKVNKVREWLLYAVTKAEKELGAGTGKLKLRYVYDMFVARFEWLAKVITFDMFSMMVDEALEQMRTMLDSNEAVQKLIANEAGEGSE